MEHQEVGGKIDEQFALVLDPREFVRNVFIIKPNFEEHKSFQGM